MNERQRFIRKIIYVCAAVALLLPLSWLSQPETKESDGGLLASMRKANHLSQATLGEIDPASETIKLVTLGMRGVAANILWEKANYYHKVEDWASLSATYEQIARLQPNFITVWVFQSWNLSYNISVEFDDYHDRYYWVMKGVDFLKEGTTYNTDEPRLLSEIGWILGQKIGRADEHVQFRRLFREDDDFHGSRPLAQRDNWLVGREWILQAHRLVDEKGIPVKGKTPLLFYAQSPMCLINYSEALEEEGTFGEVAKSAWKKSADAWDQYSNHDLPTQFNFSIRLKEKELYQQRSAQAQAELERQAPGLRQKIIDEKLAALGTADRELHDLPESQRAGDQKSQARAIKEGLKVPHLEVADRVAGENRAAALAAAEEATQYDQVVLAIDNNREIINYDYWLLRCQIEPEDNTLEARKLFFDGDKLFSAADLVGASDKYIEGMKKWRGVLDAHPHLLSDSNLTDQLVESINHYRSVLHQLDEKFPKPFILQDVVDADEAYHGSLGRKPANAPADDQQPPDAERRSSPPADATN